MVPKIALMLCLLLLVGALSVEAQREGRRRSGRRKPTTESPPPPEEPENAKPDAEPEAVAKSSSAQPTETETNAPSSEKEPVSGNQGGPPFIVPRGTRKPRPHVRNSGESRPRPTLPSFARKRGPKRERPELKKNDENSVMSSPSSTSTTTAKPARGSYRNRGQNSPERNSNVEKTPETNDEAVTETTPKKRFGGGGNRRPSRGSRRHSTVEPES